MKGLLIFLTLVGLSMGQFCPPASVLSPCYCDRSVINCNSIHGTFPLKRIMDNVASYVNDHDFVFPLLTIYDAHPILSVEENAVEYLRFERIAIWANPSIQYISPRAFPASSNVTIELNLFSNNITTEAPREGDLYELVRSFENLETVEISVNHLSSVPAQAFGSVPSLKFISLRHNEISTIGSKAFATGTDNLETLILSYNSLPSEGLPEDVFDGISTGVNVDLECNNMEFMEQRSFQTLLDRAGTVKVGGFGCPDQGRDPAVAQRLHCDERADWICQNEASYRSKLTGFLCKAESGLENVWDYCSKRKLNLV